LQPALGSRPPRVMVSVRLHSMYHAAHSYPYDLLGRQIIVADDSAVHIVYKNLRGTYEKVYRYDQLSLPTTISRAGEAGWKRPGMTLLFTGAFTFLMSREQPVARLVSYILLGLGAVFYAASFRRFTWQYFDAIGGDSAFALLLPEDQEMADYIKAKIPEDKRLSVEKV
jgi:hypothetical protein